VNELDYTKALMLGVVQGLTEFLPVSSSGHLVICQQIFGMKGDSPSMLLFDVLTHVGTLMAVVIVFAATFARFARTLLAEASGAAGGRGSAWRIAGLAVLACVPTAVIGFAFKDRFEAAFDSLTATGIGLLITGALLFTTGRLPRPRRGWRQFGWWRAALIGIAQGAAILPGISRSGATIAVALMLGVRRRWAAEFSFLIAVPAIIGAGLIKIAEATQLPADTLDALPWGPIVVGSVAALVVGAAALLVLIHLVVRNRLQLFAVYCWPLAASVLIWAGLR
jgi:undecaprenyl-diphosphatase